jgi:hypothetical protein
LHAADVLRVLKQLGIDAAVKALTAQTSENQPHKGNSSWRCAQGPGFPKL